MGLREEARDAETSDIKGGDLRGCNRVGRVKPGDRKYWK